MNWEGLPLWDMKFNYLSWFNEQLHKFYFSSFYSLIASQFYTFKGPDYTVYRIELTTI